MLNGFEPLSGVSEVLFLNQMPGPELLIEEWLRRTPDEQLRPMIYFIRDWMIANATGGFKNQAKFYHQEKDKIDEACELFRAKRHIYCPENNEQTPGQETCHLFQLCFLMDCMIYVGADKEAENKMMAYLNEHSAAPPVYDSNRLVTDPDRHNKVYNYVLQNGKMRIVNKTFYHSEAACGKAVEGSGEVAAIVSQGQLYILVNGISGHYRPLPSSLQKVEAAIFRDVEAAEIKFVKPQIIICDKYLLAENLHDILKKHSASLQQVTALAS